MRISLYASLLACGLAMANGHQAPIRPSGGSPGPALAVEKADQLLKRSNFVFVGTVVQTHASNLSSVPGSQQTTLVHVDRVLHGASLLADSLGHVITVRSERSADHKVGQTSTFFLNVDTYGESLCGMEMGRFTQQPGDDVRHAQMVADARLQGEDRDMAVRIRSSEQVIKGRVVRVEPAEIEERESEHEAMWQRAVVEVDTVIKGQPGTRTVSFFFPASQDRVWMGAPRFTVGQEGVWLLHAKPKDFSRKAEMIPGLTALDPKDFQRPEQRERLQRLANNR
jgi:hypothetical protein